MLGRIRSSWVVVVLLIILISAGAYLFHLLKANDYYSDSIDSIIDRSSKVRITTPLWSARVVMWKSFQPTGINNQTYTLSELEIQKNKILDLLPANSSKFVEFFKFQNGKYGGFILETTSQGKEVLSTLGIANNIYNKQFEPLASIQKSPQNDDDVYSCESNDECISVGSGCGCNAGGGNIAISIYYSKYWQEKSTKNRTICLQVISDHSSCSAIPKCISGKCELK